VISLAFVLGAIAPVACRPGSVAPGLVPAPPSPAVALAGLPAGALIPVRVETDAGVIRCQLDAGRTPAAVALFVGLATGRAVWRDPRTRTPTRAPLYRDLVFHRGIPGVLVQSGDPLGDGTGHPGYRIAVESNADDRARLAQPGALLLARYTPPPGRADPAPPPPGHVIGSQFVIALTDMSHLAGQVSVIGRCVDLEVVRGLAARLGSGVARPRLIRVSVP
jgi:peptidyl-prolyl cis-trans isomerase A (cyclophilin A)